MNLNLLYTIGIGNSKSNKYIFIMQFIMYMITVNLTNPIQAIVLSLVLAVVVSTIFIAVLSYYNSDNALHDDDTRYIKSLDDKNRVFRRLIIESYLVSLALVIVFYLLEINVAKYSIYTAPASFLLLLVFLINHEKSMNVRFAELRAYKWTFDYKHTPVISTMEKGEKIEIKMFDDKNNFVIAKSESDFDIKELFDLIPPGTKILHSELAKPNFKVIQFETQFKYININTASSIYLKNENKHDEKVRDLYIDVLSKYKDIYDIGLEEKEALKTQIKFNEHEIETYVDKNDYIKKFVASNAVMIPCISIKLKDELSSLPLRKVIRRIGQKVKKYDFEKNEKGIFISEIIGNNAVESDISYLEKYMSLNEEEYHAPKAIVFDENADSEDEEHNYLSFKEKLDDSHSASDVPMEREADKTLFRINLKGELIYIFEEDFATLSELDDLIITRFINSDISDMLEIANQNRI